MTREEQIKETARQRANQYDHPSKWSDTYYGFIDGAKWADSHPNWIPVKRELPKKDGKYLFYDKVLGHEVSIYYDGVTLVPSITHWMTKPQPPQVKEE